MAETKTKLFNIRIEEHKHKAFKKYASDNNISMGGLLHSYIDALLDGEIDPIGVEEGQSQAKWEDPLDRIRNQYQRGRDY
jgi:hypothetical protein